MDYILLRSPIDQGISYLIQSSDEHVFQQPYIDRSYHSHIFCNIEIANRQSGYGLVYVCEQYKVQ